MQGFIWFTVVVFLILATFSGCYIYYSNNYIKPLLLGERKPTQPSAKAPDAQALPTGKTGV